MISPLHFTTVCEESGVTLFTGVPDSLLKNLCSHIMANLPSTRHVLTANEGAAVGTAIGHYLRTGELAAVYLQNSGFGNAVNPLLSLADPEVYGIPMVLIVGWRGQPGIEDEPQHVKQGRIMERLISAMEYPCFTLPKQQAKADNCVRAAADRARELNSPVVILVEKDTFDIPSVGVSVGSLANDLASREDALKAFASAVGHHGIIVSTTGMLSRELFEFRESQGSPGDLDFLTVGGMGHASSIALGISLRERAREVWCFDGDGALLMHAGTLAVIGKHGSSNFKHVVFNNGVHDSVGGQPTAINNADVVALALANGYAFAASTDTLENIPALVDRLQSAEGPGLIEVRVRPGNRKDIGRPTKTPLASKTSFMAALANEPS